MPTGLLVFVLIALVAIAMIFMAVGHLTSRINSTTHSMHKQQFWYEWTWIIAVLLDLPFLFVAYGHWPGNSQGHSNLVVWMWICIGLLLVEFVALNCTPNRDQGPRGRRLPQ